MSDGLVYGLLSFACLPLIYVVFTKVLPLLLAGLSSVEPKSQRRLKPHPDPIPTLYYGEVVEENPLQLKSGDPFDEFWDKVERGERIILD